MNIIEGTCPVCHGRIGIPTETEYARCPLCNATFRIAAAATPQTTVAAPAPVSPMPTGAGAATVV